LFVGANVELVRFFERSCRLGADHVRQLSVEERATRVELLIRIENACVEKTNLIVELENSVALGGEKDQQRIDQLKNEVSDLKLKYRVLAGDTS
jgi:hypothetical protein